MIRDSNEWASTLLHSSGLTRRMAMRTCWVRGGVKY